MGSVAEMSHDDVVLGVHVGVLSADGPRGRVTLDMFLPPTCTCDVCGVGPPAASRGSSAVATALLSAPFSLNASTM